MIHVSAIWESRYPGFRSLKPRVYAFALVVGLALLLPRAGRAQNLSFGSINGTVTDTSGGALPGVTVTASSPALQVGQLTATTDGEGKYQVVDLPRGTYEVRFELQGFQPLIRKDVSWRRASSRASTFAEHRRALEAITVTGASQST
jgi:hypothetical protein